uniref:Tubulin folding cofactor B n=1 Tax=Equus caballus TaxID=9796 RepID=A0A9L0TLF7_HORSE
TLLPTAPPWPGLHPLPPGPSQQPPPCLPAPSPPPAVCSPRQPGSQEPPANLSQPRWPPRCSPEELRLFLHPGLCASGSVSSFRPCLRHPSSQKPSLTTLLSSLRPSVVIDHSGARLGEFEDVSKVKKYSIPEEAYDQRQDSVRSFLKRSKLGRYSEEEQAQQKAENSQRLTEEKAQASAIPVGSRCEVRAPGQPPRRGTVMYVGLTDFKPGYWIGVRYDEPLGKNDGSVNGKRYFECQAKYGAFVKPSVVTVGDFPEEDYGLDEM